MGAPPQSFRGARVEGGAAPPRTPLMVPQAIVQKVNSSNGSSSNLIASLTGLDKDEITKVSGENINTTRHYSDLRIQHISGRETN